MNNERKISRRDFLKLAGAAATATVTAACAVNVKPDAEGGYTAAVKMDPTAAKSADVAQPVAAEPAGAVAAETSAASVMGSCSDQPVNPHDGQRVPLVEGEDYIVEDWNRDPKVNTRHYSAVTADGDDSVFAKGERQGQRAWGCTTHDAALQVADRNATHWKEWHPEDTGMKVFGPTGAEVK